MNHREASGRSEFSINAFWAAERDRFSAIYKNGFGAYAETIPDISEAFHLIDREVRCIDEGTPGGVHAAGSGILMEARDAIEAFRLANATAITSHAGCGAAALYAKRNGLDVSRADEYGKKWAQDLAAAMRVPYAGNINFTALKRPRYAHIARVCYHDGTGNFDYSKTAGLPSGFIVSRRYVSKKSAEEEVRIAADIALGEHGFGEKFTGKEPFLLVAIGDGSAGACGETRLMQELYSLRDEFHGRVKVDGFTVSVLETIS